MATKKTAEQKQIEQLNKDAAKNKKATEKLLGQVGNVDNVAKDMLDLLDEASSKAHKGAADMNQQLRKQLVSKLNKIIGVTGKILPG